MSTLTKKILDGVFLIGWAWFFPSYDSIIMAVSILCLYKLIDISDKLDKD